MQKKKWVSYLLIVVLQIAFAAFAEQTSNKHSDDGLSESQRQRRLKHRKEWETAKAHYLAEQKLYTYEEARDALKKELKDGLRAFFLRPNQTKLFRLVDNFISVPGFSWGKDGALLLRVIDVDRIGFATQTVLKSIPDSTILDRDSGGLWVQAFINTLRKKARDRSEEGTLTQTKLEVLKAINRVEGRSLKGNIPLKTSEHPSVWSSIEQLASASGPLQSEARKVLIRSERLSAKFSN